MSQTEKAGAGQDRPRTQPAAGKPERDYKSRDGRDRGSKYDASGRQRSGGRQHGQGGERRQSGDHRQDGERGRDFNRQGEFGHERDTGIRGDFAGVRQPRGKNRVYARRDGSHADAADYQDSAGLLADTGTPAPRDGAQQPRFQPERSGNREGQPARGRGPKAEPAATAAPRGAAPATPLAGANGLPADANKTGTAADGRQQPGATGRGRHAHTAPRVKAEETIDDIRADIVRIEKEIGLEIMEIQSLNLAL